MAQRRRNYKKLIWWGAGILVVVLIVVGVVIGVNSQNGKNDKSDESGTEKVEQKKEQEDEKTESKKGDEEVEKKVIQYTGEDPNTLDELTGAITYAGTSGDVLMIRTNIDQYLTEGVCELTLNRAGAIIYSDTTNIVGGASTATCQGFDIATAELGEGNLEIIINLNADGKSGAIRGEASI